MTKTRVIGAGVIGASGAYRLTQAGAAVTVLEAMRIGATPPALASPGPLGIGQSIGTARE